MSNIAFQAKELCNIEILIDSYRFCDWRLNHFRDCFAWKTYLHLKYILL